MASATDPFAPPAAEPRAFTPLAAAAKVLKPLASLQVTVGLFSLGMVLVFFGTLAQMNKGIWTVVDQYFWSWVVWIPLDLVAKFLQVFFASFGFPRDLSFAGAVPFPGGKLLGGAMLVNLIAAHMLRFRVTWKRSGILLIHSGLILLFVGEFITREYQVEQRMRIEEGQTTNYAEDTRAYELAVIDRSDPAGETVTVIPHIILARGGRIIHPDLPVDIDVLEYMPNSELVKVETVAAGVNRATAGMGTGAVAERRAEVSGVDPNQKIDLPSAYVRLLKKGTEETIGTHLVSIWQSLMSLPADRFAVGGKHYGLELRNTRYYKPFSLHLIDFRFDRYVGTNTPKNYSSDVRLVDPERGVDRVQRIAMNEPLAYRGETFYQSSFEPGETVTILQVVRNPGELIPYISCVMVSGGMLLHFGIYLFGFLTRPRPAAGLGRPMGERAPRGDAERFIPLGVLALGALYLLSRAGQMLPPTEPYNLRAFAQVPVVDGGRLKPLDTVARVSLRAISGRETFKDQNDDTRPAIRWYLDVAAAGGAGRSGPAMKYKVFKIDNDQVLGLLKLQPRSGFLYALDEFADKMDVLQQKANEAAKRPQDQRDKFDVKVLEVAGRVKLYIDLAELQSPLTVPAAGKGRVEDWASYPDALVKFRQTAVEAVRAKGLVPKEDLSEEGLKRLAPEKQAELVDAFHAVMDREIAANPATDFWTQAIRAYRAEKPDEFNKQVTAYLAKYVQEYGPTTKVRLEAYDNGFAPFYTCLVLYGLAFAVGLAYLLALLAYGEPTGVSEGLRLAGFRLLLATAVVHGLALLARMYFQDRWLVFVTNLYSSAIFIGFGSVLLGLLLEKVYPLGIGNLIASVLGFTTSIVAHNYLLGDKDTLEMMQAVLDTNFWLATHVTCVTLGYTATFVAGAVGIAYVLLGLFTPVVRGETSKVLGNMLYAVVCFATLLSFTGTVLGGIWADYSWGRFWGWDPKENGAVLIVIWNSLILHARWSGLVKTRGMAVLAILGNMVTVWSWFGTNQLGIGLHAYGFDNTLATACAVTWLVHLGLVCAGLIPQRHWISFQPAAAPAAGRRKPAARVR